MDKHLLRRALLEIAKYFGPEAPVTIGTFFNMPELRCKAVTREQIIEEAANLALHGYMKNVRPGREPLYVITGKGSDQIDLEADLDEFIWDERASKFKG